MAGSLGGCIAAPPPPTPATPRSVHAELQGAVADARCDSDAQCRSLPIGYKACGGPASYLAWSTARSDEAKLKRLAQQLTELERAESQRSGMVSDCRVVTDPGAQCAASRCQLRSSEAGNRPIQIR